MRLACLDGPRRLVDEEDLTPLVRCALDQLLLINPERLALQADIFSDDGWRCCDIGAPHAAARVTAPRNSGLKCELAVSTVNLPPEAVNQVEGVGRIHRRLPSREQGLAVWCSD